MLRKLRRDLQTVRRRHYFPPPEREAATQALGRLARAITEASTEPGSEPGS